MFNLRRFVSISTRANLTAFELNNKAIKYSSTSGNPQQISRNSPILISDNCVKRLKELKAVDSNKRLRVLVDSGGCSGFEYKFSLDTEIKPDDILLEKEGCQIIVDQASLPYLQGATLDHYEELIRTGFRVVNNPNSEQGCSCGSSFSIKI